MFESMGDFFATIGFHAALCGSIGGITKFLIEKQARKWKDFNRTKWFKLALDAFADLFIGAVAGIVGSVICISGTALVQGTHLPVPLIVLTSILAGLSGSIFLKKRVSMLLVKVEQSEAISEIEQLEKAVEKEVQRLNGTNK